MAKRGRPPKKRGPGRPPKRRGPGRPPKTETAKKIGRPVKALSKKIGRPRKIFVPVANLVLKLDPAEKQAMRNKAIQLTNGNLTQLIRQAVIAYRPKKWEAALGL